MKKEKRECAHPDCNITFEAKNPKKRWCSDTCKNDATKRINKLINGWEIQLVKRRKENSEILENLLKNNRSQLFKTDLIRMGVDFKVANTPVQDKNGSSGYRFGNIGLNIFPDGKCEIFTYPYYTL